MADSTRATSHTGPTPDDGRVLRFATLPVSAWANGQGQTVELWRTPETGAFDVRLSVATVATAAAFSSLPGVERALMPLAAAGLRLDVDGERVHVPQYDAIRFAGEVPVRSVDVHEPGRDLNLMVRRGTGTPTLAAARVDGALDEAVIADAVAVIALDGSVAWRGIPLAACDTVLAPRGGAVIGSGIVAIARLV